MLGKGLESLIPPREEDAPETAAATSYDPSKEKDAQGSSPKPPHDSGLVGTSAQPEAPKEKPMREEGDYIFHIETEKISPNPTQPRRNFNEEGIRELANSVREFGFLQPLVVTKIETETPEGVAVKYQLIAGERRLLAAKLLGLEVVPAIIRNVDLEREKLELAVIENIQRENLNPIETARAFQRLQEEFRLTQREIASRLGKSREAVANVVRLLDLPSYIQEALERGEITESHGRFLLAIENPAAQKRLFDDIVLNKLTTRDVRERVRREKEPAGGLAHGDELPPELKMIQERLSAELGTPVSIHKKGGEAGKIEISFFSKEELQNILNKFGGEG